jgi:hypothetical protein
MVTRQGIEPSDQQDLGLKAAQIADLAAYVRSFDKSLKATRKTKQLSPTRRDGP